MSTIKDVAKYAGVSTATISYVLNGTKSVLPETREKVLEAVKALNYSPNPTARSFKTGKKHAVAFIIPDISNNYFSNITKALEHTLQEYGYSLILVNTNESLENEIMQIRQMTSGIVDGILLASTARNFVEIERYIPKKFPVVLIDRKLNGCPFDIVTASDKAALYEGIKELVEKGHKRIGYIGDSLHLSTAIERQETYRKALKDHEIPVDEKLIVHTPSMSHGAYKEAGKLLEAGCTALVVTNNIMTIDAYSYVKNHQDEYADIQILGYEHKDISPKFYANAGIIALNEMDLGKAAGEQIIHRIKEPDSGQREIMIRSMFMPDGRYTLGVYEDCSR